MGGMEGMTWRGGVGGEEEGGGGEMEIMHSPMALYPSLRSPDISRSMESRMSRLAI